MPLKTCNTVIYTQLKDDNWIALSYSVNGIQVIGARVSEITSPTGGAVVDTQLRATINSILNLFTAHGLMGGTSPSVEPSYEPSVEPDPNAVIDGGILVVDGGVEVIDS
jgi:hypothetical protein